LVGWDQSDSACADNYNIDQFVEGNDAEIPDFIGKKFADLVI
jgi:hypothetical protein